MIQNNKTDINGFDVSQEEHSSLFESLPSVEYRKLEEEFDKIALMKCDEEEVLPEAKTEQDSDSSGPLKLNGTKISNTSQDLYQDTPKRPRDLNIPSLRNSEAWRNLPNEDSKPAPAPVAISKHPESPELYAKESPFLHSP